MTGINEKKEEPGAIYKMKGEFHLLRQARLAGKKRRTANLS